MPFLVAGRSFTGVWVKPRPAEDLEFPFPPNPVFASTPPNIVPLLVLFLFKGISTYVPSGVLPLVLVLDGGSGPATYVSTKCLVVVVYTHKIQPDAMTLQ